MLKSFLVAGILSIPFIAIQISSASTPDAYTAPVQSTPTDNAHAALVDTLVYPVSFFSLSVAPAPTPFPSSSIALPAQAVSAAPPAHIDIPSIELNAPIQKVGLNEKGEMAVPSGSTNNVGWYQFGTIPGHDGSAVLDAHVFAAFSKLKNLKVGSDIYIETVQGEKLHFVVRDSRVYKLAEVPAQKLFNATGAQFLNLITCAGRLLPDGSTYDHRLVVYAQLVEDGS